MDDALGFHVHRSNRLERLADLLTGALASDRPSDPFESIPVVVGSRGMARWLRNRIAGAPGLGICGGIDFPFPAPFLREAVFRVLGADLPDTDPWSIDRLTWTVLDVLRERLGDAEFAPVRRSLGVDVLPAVVGRRHLSLARSLADVLDRYVHARPEWIARWRCGQTIAPEVSADEAWQARLWREVEARVGPAGAVQARGRAWPAHVGGLIEALDAAVREGWGAPLPTARVHVFGMSSLPPLFLRAFALLGRAARVELYLLTPSDGYWGDYQTLPEARRLLRRASPAMRAAVEAGLADQHPLLTGLGRLSRDFQNLLEGLPDDGAGSYVELPGVELFDGLGGDAEKPGGVLQRLQRHLRALEDPRRARVSDPGSVDPADDSLRIHSCAGPTRQVEVLRDELLGLLVDHPHLQPRDIVVMTPDVETYAPLVAAAFSEGLPGDAPRSNGAGLPGEVWGSVGAPRLPFEIADLSLRRTNPVADVLLSVLALSGGRVTATAVADLLRHEAVRARFGLDAAAVDTIRAWLGDSGIRWGVDAADRARVGQPDDDQNTFRFGLERLALGVVAGESDALFGARASPLGVADDDLELVGRFSSFCEALFGWLRELERPRSGDAWGELLKRLVHGLTATGANAAWLTEQVHDGLEATLADAGAFPGELAVDAVLHALEGRFEVGGEGDRANTGAITVCALAPMRSVPFAVVALLGLDDARFPRRGTRAGFDLTRGRPAPGDREPRDEDRHLLLEALLSAREHLLVFYSGRDASTDERLPAAVPVAELQDAVEASFVPPAGLASLRELVLVDHPIQPFSEHVFRAPRSFDRRLRQVALRLRQERAPRAGLFPAGVVLPPLPGGVDELRLDDLASALLRPTRHLLQRRLGLHLSDLDDTLADREPVELEGRGLRALDDRIFSALVAAGSDQDPARTLERVRRDLTARGGLPHGAGGLLDLERRAAALGPLADLAGARVRGAGPRQVVVTRPGNRRLTGRIPWVDPAGTIVDAQSRAPDRGDRLVAAWLGLLALQAQQPLARRDAFLYGLQDDEPVCLRLRAPEGATSLTLLHRLAELHDRALERPLVLYERSSRGLAEGLLKDGAPSPWEALPFEATQGRLEKLAEGWTPEEAGRGVGDGDDTYVAAAWPNGPTFDHDEAARRELLALAELVWRPILEALGGEPEEAP